MMFYLEIDTSAFGPHPVQDIKNLLRGLADDLPNYSGVFRGEGRIDHNGNDIGSWSLEPIEPEGPTYGDRAI